MNLDQLKSRLDNFVEFSRKFPAAYRPAIITYLLQLDAAERGAGVAGVAVGSPASIRSSVPSAEAVSAAPSNVDLAIVEVAGEINVAPESVNRRLVTVIDGKPEIRYKSEDVSKAKRQVEYSLVYAYVLEKLGEEGAPLEDLRVLCNLKRCYDQANFMATFKRQYNLMQLADVPGLKEQEVVLTGPGRQRARDILTRAADRLPPAAVSTRAVAPTIPLDAPDDEAEDQADLGLGLDREEDVEPVS